MPHPAARPRRTLAGMPATTRIDVELNAVILAVTDEVPRVLTVPATDPATGERRPALPSGRLDPENDRTLDRGLRRWVREQAGLDVGYVEQLYTFGDRHRHPEERLGGPRVLAIAYLALMREELPSHGAAWAEVYDFFALEERRDHDRAAQVEAATAAVEDWVDAAGEAEERRLRRERAQVTFGMAGAPWDPVRVLERYELLYELGGVTESGGREIAGRPMALDHRRMLGAALGRLRGKLGYRPVVFEMLPEAFTLLQLQSLVEALAGIHLHKGNFRRLVEAGRLVEGTGRRAASTGGRPAELFRFRREVLLERPRPGLRLTSR